MNSPMTLADMGYRAGFYFCTCKDCGGTFSGAKKSWRCHICATEALAPARPDRDAVARIIDPWAFKQCEWAIAGDNDEVLKAYLPQREAALAKADAILAILEAKDE